MKQYSIREFRANLCKILCTQEACEVTKHGRVVYTFTPKEVSCVHKSQDKDDKCVHNDDECVHNVEQDKAETVQNKRDKMAIAVEALANPQPRLVKPKVKKRKLDIDTDGVSESFLAHLQSKGLS